jgi:hypothetical protein
LKLHIAPLSLFNISFGWLTHALYHPFIFIPPFLFPQMNF